ncbi:hypothetical protein [[Pseudomonas] boreopolis]|uniref:hypothetical protein n=1 Tax=Xanthomonas boreopolis TaxID=86183 RepID=UPI003DA14481
MSSRYIPGFKRHLRSVAIRHAASSLASIALGTSAFAAHACVADTSNLIGTSDHVYTSFSAGAIISDWKNVAQSRYLMGCTGHTSNYFGVSAVSAPIGSHGGYWTYPTSNPNIGAQVRYRYPAAVDSGGWPVWSDWEGLEDAGKWILVWSHEGADLYTTQVSIDMQMRFVALNDLSGDQSVGRGQIINIDTDNWGVTAHQKVFEAYTLFAPRGPACWFTALPPGRIGLPKAYDMKLNKEGAVSDPYDFTWSWQCDDGNTGHTGGGDFKYDAATAVTGKGRMSVTGGAKGVDLLVTTTRNGAGRYVPVEFGKWYSHLSGGGLGGWGTERLRVQYIRNAEPDLVVGPANGGLKIVLEPY